MERRRAHRRGPLKRKAKRKDDDVSTWARDKRGLFVPLAHDIQEATKEVLVACPRLMAQRGADRNSADPFVVGLALARGGSVVTEKSLGSGQKRPRIPDACMAVGVRYVTLPEFVAEQPWQITLGSP